MFLTNNEYKTFLIYEDLIRGQNVRNIEEDIRKKNS